MELEIRIGSDRENKFMKRREIGATAAYTGSTPTRDTVKQELCKKLGLNPDSSAIVRISQAYGSMSSTIMLHSYKTREEMLALEKEGRKKKAKPAGKPAGEKAPEAKDENAAANDAGAKQEEKRPEAKKEEAQEKKDEAKKE
ncbi:MAG: hypothetical protein M1321_00155 [Candidatus Marsarchaeota archaeon]|nr:hypothetical protein [Candidatus Marsarchaeota archaeon]